MNLKYCSKCKQVYAPYYEECYNCGGPLKKLDDLTEKKK